MACESYTNKDTATVFTWKPVSEYSEGGAIMVKKPEEGFLGARNILFLGGSFLHKYIHMLSLWNFNSMGMYNFCIFLCIFYFHKILNIIIERCLHFWY